jgi:hypothetical protein
LALGDLALLDISIDQDTDKYAWSSTLRLADRFRLTFMTPPTGTRMASLPPARGARRGAARGLDVLLIGVST